MRCRGERWTRRTVLASAVCLVLGAAPGVAHAGWDPPEPIASGVNISRLFLAPGGPGYVIGFPLSGPSRFRFAQRPIGGTLGPAFEFPGTSGTNFDGTWTFDAAGDAVIANTYEGTIGYRSVSNDAGPTEALGPGLRPQQVSVAPSGEALIGYGGSSGPAKVASRAAGTSANVNLAGAETLSATGMVVGLLLQADGGAIVVWQEGDTLLQAVRQPGVGAFGATMPIVDPRPDVRKFSVRFDSDPSGHAMLTWLGSSGGLKRDQAVATYRSPGGAFGPAQIVGTGGTIVNVTPGVTSKGDGLVVWRHDFAGGSGCDVTVMGSALHAGAFAPQAPLGPATVPLTSIPSDSEGVFSNGDDVAVGMIQVEDGGTPCSFGDDARGLFVHHFRSGANGLVDLGTSELSPMQRRAGGVTSYPTMSERGIEPTGKILALYNVDAARYLRSFDGVPPGVPGGGSAPPAAALPSSAPPKTAILPLQPGRYIRLAPIDPTLRTVSMGCTVDDVASGDCGAKLYAYYLFTRKPKETAGQSAAKPKPKLVRFASAQATIKAGTSKRVKLKLNAAGRRLVATGRRTKVFLDVTITRGGKTATARLTTTLKARRR